MVKNIEYYLNLPYKIEIERIPAEEGGGFLARLPQFGKLGIIGDGDTIEEALKNLEEAKRLRFDKYIKEGISIPEPDKEASIDDYSGKFVIRIPKYLHYTLVNEAKHNGVSLNQFITSLLAAGLTKHRSLLDIKEIFDEIKAMRKYLCDIKYNLESNLSICLNSSMPEFSIHDYEYSEAEYDEAA